MSQFHSLKDHLRHRIFIEGPMTIASFMTEILFHCYQGYDTEQDIASQDIASDDLIGPKGHFITAPEISQMFGELLGLWCLDIWLRHGAPHPTRMIELGPGRGTLMQDFLRATSVVPAFHHAMTLHMIEISPSLRAAQQTRLDPTTVHWHTQLDDVEEGFVVIIANEFFDCLPIHQLQRTEHGWCERLIDADRHQHELYFVVEREPNIFSLLVPETCRSAPISSIFECSPARQNFLHLLITRMIAHGGVLLMIDYGYQDISNR